MSIIGRTFEKAIKDGQNSMTTHLESLKQQNDMIIDNMNEIIQQQKKICDKLGIDCDIEDD